MARQTLLTDWDCRLIVTARHEPEVGLMQDADWTRIAELKATGLLEDDLRLTETGDAAYWSLRPDGERAAWICGYLDENFGGLLLDLERQSLRDTAIAWRSEDAIISEGDLQDAIVRWNGWVNSPPAWFATLSDRAALCDRFAQLMAKHSNSSQKSE